MNLLDSMDSFLFQAFFERETEKRKFRLHNEDLCNVRRFDNTRIVDSEEGSECIGEEEEEEARNKDPRGT